MSPRLGVQFRGGRRRMTWVFNPSYAHLMRCILRSCPDDRFDCEVLVVERQSNADKPTLYEPIAC